MPMDPSDHACLHIAYDWPLPVKIKDRMRTVRIYRWPHLPHLINLNLIVVIADHLIQWFTQGDDINTLPLMYR